MKSMTAYGESAVDTDIGKVSVEIRSENHRFLDLKIQASESLYNLESIVSELVSKNIVRGKLRLKMALIENTKNSIIKNENILKQNYNLLKKAKKEVGIKDDIKLEHILQFKELTNYEYNVELSKENRKALSGLSLMVLGTQSP